MWVVVFDRPHKCDVWTCPLYSIIALECSSAYVMWIVFFVENSFVYIFVYIILS